MEETSTNLIHEIREWQEKLFRRSIRRTRKMHQMEELLGTMSNSRCLEISSGDSVVSTRLRALGGSWKTATATTEAAHSVASSIGDSISFIHDGKLPFEDQSFDMVVIADALKEIALDGDFIYECHRVLKTDGWVVISETCRRPVSLVALLQRIFGVTPTTRGAQRNGYTNRELYAILKDGFDVPETITYSNGLFESAATFGELVQKVITGGPCWLVRKNPKQEDLYSYRQLYTLAGLAYPLLWLLASLEFLPGHKLLVKSRRRPWRPRNQPKLVDGRSIAEATINTKIGTAAPF
jgi:ubiquinone/menaquinone biosynthesis C-methylase UbiE